MLLVPVPVPKSVNLGAGLNYPHYGNTTTLGDCLMATAADWLTTIKGSAPSTASIEADYFAAEWDAGIASNHGLTLNALLDYWANHGIDGTHLEGGTDTATFDIPTVIAWFRSPGTLIDRGDVY